MSQKDQLFLSRTEILAAIRIDFNQYKPQNELFRQLCPIILNKYALPGDDCEHQLRLCSPGGDTGGFMTWKDLGNLLCDALDESAVSLEELADICAMVFQARAFPGKDPDSGDHGIRIETDIETFHCRQCGRCCRNLNYHDECTAEDYALWQELGKTDILKWVAMAEVNGKSIPRHIWVYPGTNRYARVCPWLGKQPDSDIHICRIHDVKPEICRQYPGTRKHAMMTGCPGFNESTRP